MAVTVRPHVAGNVAANSAGGSASVTANKPNGLAVGDVWMIFHARRSAAVDTGVPAGFTLLGPSGAHSSGISRIYWKVADAADVAGGAIGWTQTTTDRWQTISVAIAGADVNGTIFDAESPVDATDASSPFSTAGLTPNVNGVLLVLAQNATILNTFSAPTTQGGGWSTQAQVQMDAGAATSRMAQAIFYKAMAAGGATGAISLTGSVTTQSTNVRAIHINEAPAGDTTAPTAPTALNAADGPTPVLTWTQGTDAVGVTRNKIKRSTVSGSGYVEIADIAANTTYTDTSAAAGTTYYYVVTALDAALNESPNSAQDAAGTPSRVTKDAGLHWRTYSRVAKDLDLRWGVSVRAETKDIELRWSVAAATLPTKNTSVRLTFPSPPSNLVTGAGLQEFRLEMRKQGSGTPHPSVTAQLYENGVQRGPNFFTNRNVTSASQVEMILWDAALLSDLSGEGVELVVSTQGDSARWAEIVDVEWNANHEFSTTQRVSKDIEFRWNVSERVTADSDLRWNVSARIAPKDIDLRWSVSSRIVPKDTDLRWRTYARITPKDIDARWRTYARITPKDADLRWRTYARVAPKDIDLRWRIGARVTGDVDLRWRTLVGFSVSKDIDLRWSVAAPITRVTKDLDLRWSTAAATTRVTKDIGLRWQTLSRVPAKDIGLHWRTYAKVAPKDVDLRWSTLFRIAPKDADLRWRTYARIAPKDIDARWSTYARAAPKDTDLRWRTHGPKSNDVRLTFQDPLANLIAGAGLQEFRVELRKVGTGTPHPQFTAQLFENGVQVGPNLVTNRNITSTSQVESLLWDASTLSNLSGAGVELRISTSGTTDIYAELVNVEWNANHELTPYTRISKDIDLRWAASGRVARDTDLRWQTLFRIAPQTVDLRWRTAAKVSDDTDLRWRVLARVFDDADLRWRIYQRAEPKDIDLRWAVAPVTTSRVTKDIDLRWKASGRTSKDLDLRWQTLARVSQVVDVRWRVLVGVPVAKDIGLRWRTLAPVSKDIGLRWRVAAFILQLDVRAEILPKTRASIEIAPKTRVAWEIVEQPVVEVEVPSLLITCEVLPKVHAEMEVAKKVKTQWDMPPKPHADVIEYGKTHVTSVEVINT